MCAIVLLFSILTSSDSISFAQGAFVKSRHVMECKVCENEVWNIKCVKSRHLLKWIFRKPMNMSNGFLD